MSAPRWLEVVPEQEGDELEDRDIPVPAESPYVTRMRDAPGGPYILAPDSTDWVPPDALAVPLADLKKVEEKVIESSNALQDESPQEQVLVPRAQRDYLRETKDPAAEKLLEVLEHGVQGAAESAGAAA